MPGWTRPVDPEDPDTEWASRLRPVLTALAAAGPGPVMPLPLLAAVSAELDLVRQVRTPQSEHPSRQVLHLRYRVRSRRRR